MKALTKLGSRMGPWGQIWTVDMRTKLPFAALPVVADSFLFELWVER